MRANTRKNETPKQMCMMKQLLFFQCRNVPVPELSEVDRAEIERKAKEIETGKRSEEIDEDDAGN